MNFPGSVVMENPYRLDIQQTAAIQGLGSDSGFNFRRFYYPASLSSTYFTTELTVNSVMRRSAYEMVDSLHDSNEHPYGFAWYSQAYELLGSSLGQG